jgi:polysaccharide biosynthesis/export protein
MLNRWLDKIELTSCGKNETRPGARTGTIAVALCAAVAMVAVTGCQSETKDFGGSASPPVVGWPGTNSPAATNAALSTMPGKSLVLQEGDTISVDFPGAPNFDISQTIRRDGKVSLKSYGEYVAAGKTPTEMEEDLKKIYEKQLVNNEVSVTVQQSAFVLYMMGAIGRPGKLTSERPLTPMEALIESGVDPARSNLKSIRVIRTDASGHTEKYKINLYGVLHKKGEQMPAFALKPNDIIFVPERFSFY